ncbi:MAG: TrpB-like pyridoxal phosphate-dependent enzyme [Isosphaera sp.]|nr:TrpB-like pyridoxal phosphate-dependent enzyme [Isosphaera sp.]
MRDEIPFTLQYTDVPSAWYNAVDDLPVPVPHLLDPITREAVKRADLETIFPRGVVEEMAALQRWIDIPEPIRRLYRRWRPTPLFRAHRLEQALDTPARLYFKYEGVSPTGSHKLNTAVVQAFHARNQGCRGMTTETGAGQWGSALALACRWFGLECHVYMVRVSYNQKPYRRVLMDAYGATVDPSPSGKTAVGQALLRGDPDHPGSLGVAVAEAVEEAVESGGPWSFGLGSVLPVVLTHQSVIGLEAMKQMELTGDEPDVLVGCVGGGSNWGGFVLPFMRGRWGGGPRVIAAEPAACPSLTGGRYEYDTADSAGLTPLLKMYTLGRDFVPPPIHAGGLRYHGMAPQVSALYAAGLIEAVPVPQLEVFTAATQFARTEGIVPAPESAHAVAVTLREAARCRQEGTRRVIVTNISGHGLFDLSAYGDFLAGRLPDLSTPSSSS